MYGLSPLTGLHSKGNIVQESRESTPIFTVATLSAYPSQALTPLPFSTLAHLNRPQGKVGYRLRVLHLRRPYLHVLFPFFLSNHSNSREDPRPVTISRDSRSRSIWRHLEPIASLPLRLSGSAPPIHTRRMSRDKIGLCIDATAVLHPLWCQEATCPTILQT